MAEKVGVPLAMSVSVICTETASPMALLWSPWSVIAMSPATSHSKLVVPL